MGILVTMTENSSQTFPHGLGVIITKPHGLMLINVQAFLICRLAGLEAGLAVHKLTRADAWHVEQDDLPHQWHILQGTNASLDYSMMFRRL